MVLTVMFPRRATLLALVTVALGGCLTRSLPLPPPSATIQSVTSCPVLDCPSGGVIVTIGGDDAHPGATVIAYDDSIPAPESGERLGGNAIAQPTGHWSITIYPRQLSPGVVAAVQRGHVIRVFQATTDGEASQSVYREVPRM
jgi:hypothetical protein